MSVIVQDLNKSQTKTTGPKVVMTEKEDEVTTTTHGDKSNTTTQQTLYEYQNPDGTINPEKKAAWDAMNAKSKQELADLYEVDPVTGRYKGTPGALLGFDPEQYKKEQEEKAKLARFKQKEAGWRNALGVITDIATTASGGNVWVRQPDNVAKQEDAKAEEANNNINKIGTAFAQAKAGREQAYLKAEKERLDKLLKAGQYQVTSSRSQQGQDQTTKSGGNQTQRTSQVTETTEGQYQQAMKDGDTTTWRGKTVPKQLNVRVQKTDGGYDNFKANSQDALDYADFAVARLSEWLIKHQDEQNDPRYANAYKSVQNALFSAGIKDVTGEGAGMNAYDPNKHHVDMEKLQRFLSNGHVFNIDAQDEELKKLRDEAIGSKAGKVIFKPKKDISEDEGFDPDATDDPIGGA